VLDTARGVPASDVPFALFRVGEANPLTRGVTGPTGRSARPLLEASQFTIGAYELVFEVARYFAKGDRDPPEPSFFDRIAIRIYISDPTASYHVPLLVSPWSYTTYRGS
jgi:5-hydroxyisourate hydrolase